MMVSHQVILIIAGGIGFSYVILLLYNYRRNIPYVNARVLQDPSIQAPSAIQEP